MSGPPTAAGEPAAGVPVTPHALIADDDPTMLLMLEIAVKGMGWRFDIADDGAQAWVAWERDRHSLVVTDIQMPGLDGLEFCRRIRAAEPDRRTFVIVVTGLDRAQDLETVLAAGADDYVRKPVTGQSLVARLRIAQRRMADDAKRRAAEAEVLRARWMAGIGEATMAIQHEINNPLAALMGTAELMLAESHEKGLAVEDVKVILEAAGRIKALVKRLEDLENPRAIPYVGDARMVDLRDRH